MPEDVHSIPAASYRPFAGQLKHVYLVGNLQQPVPHPFFRENRAEMVLCFYEPGDNGKFHWHPEVTEYEYMLEGRMGYFSVAQGRELWFEPGDLICVPAGACVRRLVPTRVRTLTLKVPSIDDKIACHACDRDCAYRVGERPTE